MSKQSRQWVLTSRPPGLVGPEHFELKTIAVPDPGPGEIQVKTLYLSFDPTASTGTLWRKSSCGGIHATQISSRDTSIA